VRKSCQKINKTFLHIASDLVQKCMESDVFYCPTFFKGDNNDPTNAYVWESMSSCEMIPILGTCLIIIYDIITEIWKFWQHHCGKCVWYVYTCACAYMHVIIPPWYSPQHATHMIMLVEHHVIRGDIIIQGFSLILWTTTQRWVVNTWDISIIKLIFSIYHTAKLGSALLSLLF